jgi:hypothetical protein
MQRSAVWWFAGLALATIPAFWPSYFAAPPFRDDFVHVHLHGIAMFSWMALLLAQATLIRRRGQFHRTLGKISYGLAPLIVASTLLLAHYRLQHGTFAPDLLYFFYVQLALLSLFVGCWGFAMLRRREPAIHSRFIVLATLALVDPVLARLLYLHAGLDFPATQVVTYGVVISLMAALAWSDRRRPELLRLEFAALVVFLALLLPTFFVPQTAAWKDFAVAYSRLPLP